jgi:hypothetical protein
MNHWYNIKNFPAKPFNDDADLTEFRNSRNVVTVFPTSYLSKEIHAWLEPFGLHWVNSLAFWRITPAVPARPHVDLDNQSVPIASGINFEVHGQGLMRFHTPTEKASNFAVSGGGTPYWYYDKDVVLPVEDELLFTGPALVHTEVPHSVEVIRWPRLLISLRTHTEHHKHATWNDIVSRLDPVLEQR